MAENFYFSALIPAKSLHLISFTKQKFEKIDAEVKYKNKPYLEKKKDPCDYSKEFKKYLDKIDDENLKKFKIFRSLIKVNVSNVETPTGYNFFNIPMRYLFESEPIIYAMAYNLKVTVSLPSNGLRVEDSWVFGISEKANTGEGKHHCTIHVDKLAKPFFQLLHLNHMYLDFCSSANNAEFLNFASNFRRSIGATIKSDKLFYGAEDVTHTININLRTINRSGVYSDEIQISLKIPLDICYTGNCFVENVEDPCLNLELPAYFKCSYAENIYKFILYSNKKEKISDITIQIKKMKNPTINYETGNFWNINIFTIDPLTLILNDEHKSILEAVSTDKCSKKLAEGLFQKVEGIPWVESHTVKLTMPQLKFLKLQPYQNTGLLENPLIAQFQLEYEEEKIFKNCLFELKSIHHFTSVLTKSDYRVNEYNQQLYLPNCTVKPSEISKKEVIIEKDVVKNGDIIKAMINVNRYNNKEYWLSTMKCLNSEGKYITESYYKFDYPIINEEVYISDLYIYKRVNDTAYLFYMNILALNEKEVEINIMLPTDNKNVDFKEPCIPEMFSSCYDLVFYKCLKKEKMITYHLNSYNASNKHFSIFFPINITDKSNPFEITVTSNSYTKKLKKIKKIIEVNVQKEEEQMYRNICVNDLTLTLKKYKNYNSHLFILFKAVHCDKVYIPYITSNYNNETFYVKEESVIPEQEKFNFQKTYIQKYPLNYNSIGYEMFKNNIIAIFTFIILDMSSLQNLEVKLDAFIDKVKNKTKVFAFNYYYVVLYTLNKLDIEICTTIKPAVIKCNNVKSIPQVGDLSNALERVILFSEDLKHKKHSKYMNSESAFLVLTNLENLNIIKSNSDDYIKNAYDLYKSISRIYVVSFSDETYPDNYSENLNISLQNYTNVYIYSVRALNNSLFFIMFYEYIVDTKFLFYYLKVTVDDFIFLHTKLFKASWVLIGVCRNNIIKNGKKDRNLHIYYVNKKIKTVPYKCLDEDVSSAYDNSSAYSFQDICNIFTHFQLLGYK